MSGDCPNCIRLQREATEMALELEAWRATEGERSAIITDDMRAANWFSALGLTPAMGRLVLAMADRPDMTLRRSMLADAMRRGPLGDLVLDDLADPDSLVLSQICLTRRRLLERHGLAGVIETVWSVGYRISAANALLLRQRVGEA